jgi:Ca2+-transporting ATPase
MPASAWHTQSATEVARQLEVDPARGLSKPEAARRLQEHGPNELVDKGIKSPWRILLEQLSGTLVIILIVAAAISAALGDWHDAVAIVTIVVLNALLGLRQEYKAEKAMAALKRLAVPHVKVRRGGHVQELEATQLTVGDIVQLEAGSAIPADGRLLESASVRVQEAALTGESEPVEKDAELTVADDTPLAERRNMVYLGTSSSYGRGVMLVTAVGMETELGHIAKMIQSAGGEATPLQKRLDHLGKRLAVVALVLVIAIFALGVFRGEADKPHGWRTLFLTAVSLAVAVVPEGLSAVVTIALALGSQRMLARNALIRKLPAVETLGSVTVICSDKTGTLTKNQMTVTALDVAGHSANVTEAVDDQGRARFTLRADDVLAIEEQPTLALLIAGGALCNDAVIEEREQDDDRAEPAEDEVVGDPTEGALVMAGKRLGVEKQRLEQLFPRIAEHPFDSQRKRMSTVHQPTDNKQGDLSALFPDALRQTERPIVFAKGALDSLLEVSTQVWAGDQPEPLNDQWRERISQAHDRLAQQGMRVLGVAFRTLDKTPPKHGQQPDWERELTFIGLVGMLDPPRPEAIGAIEKCHTAGIRVMMITGDHPLTAKSIAEKLGLDVSQGVVNGRELDQKSPEELAQLVRERSIYARVSPEHKLRLIEALRKQGEIVAMTGDGVNDAPALKQADIGIAMGITGTDVATEAADMVLRDDNFATIVAAIEEGRVIFDNVRKFIRYLLCTNAGEIWVMLLGLLFGMPLPLLPLQILWMNLATDGLPALALGIEPPEKNIMQRPPRAAGASVFAGGLGRDILWVGIVMALCAFGMGYWSWSQDPSGPWQTMVFMTMTLSQLFHALAVRGERHNIWQIGWFTNKALWGAIVLMFGAQMAITYVPALQRLFSTQPLSPAHLLLCIGLASVVFFAVEGEKFVRCTLLKHDA